MIKGKPFECEIDNPEDQVKTKDRFFTINTRNSLERINGFIIRYKRGK